MKTRTGIKKFQSYSDYLEIYWDDTGQLRTAKFQDIFFNRNGIEEARHVFMAGNNLPGNYKKDFHIGELGFGTGLNLFLALKIWREWGPNEVLRFTSFEIDPLPGRVMARALGQFNSIRGILREFLLQWEKCETNIKLPNLAFEIIVGDVRDTILTFNQKVDCWFLDGFSPNSNPEMWESKLFKHLAERTKSGGTLSSFSSAAMVRKNLMEAGFEITKVPGFGKKKHMIKGYLI